MASNGDNPYAEPAVVDPVDVAPQTREAALAGLIAAEGIRRKFLGHESAVRSIGLLFYVATFYGLLVSVVALFSFAGLEDNQIAIENTLFAPIAIVLTAIQFALGHGLRTLRPWARWTVFTEALLNLILSIIASSIAISSGTSGIGLLLMLCNVLIQSYILWIMISGKSTSIFSREYQAVIAKTLHINAPTSVVVKTILICLYVAPLWIPVYFVWSMFDTPR